MMIKWWWGYLHKDGTVRFGRWFGDYDDYTSDCCGKEFIIEIVKPFEATNREEAAAHIYSILEVPRDLTEHNENLFQN